MGRKEGFGLVDLTITVVLAGVLLLSLGVVVVQTYRLSDQTRAQRLVLSAARTHIERIKGMPPQDVAEAYDGQSFEIIGVCGANQDGSALNISVDSVSNPTLLDVSVTGNWMGPAHNETLSLRSLLYNADG